MKRIHQTIHNIAVTLSDMADFWPFRVFMVGAWGLILYVALYRTNRGWLDYFFIIIGVIYFHPDFIQDQKIKSWCMELAR